MDARKSKKGAFVIATIALALLIPSFIWKSLVTFAWRLGNPTAISLANKRFIVPWPWMTTKAGEQVKLRAFATQWPGMNNDYATAIISVTSYTDATLPDNEWFSRSKERYESHGFQDVKKESFGVQNVICAEAISDKQESGYCRSRQGFDVTFVGPHRLLGRLIKSLSLDR